MQGEGERRGGGREGVRKGGREEGGREGDRTRDGRGGGVRKGVRERKSIMLNIYHSPSTPYRHAHTFTDYTTHTFTNYTTHTCHTPSQACTSRLSSSAFGRL